MRPLTLFVTIAAVFFGANTVSADVPLFSREDYRFDLRSWSVKVARDGKAKVELAIAYRIPQRARFHLHVAKEYTESSLDDSNLAFEVVEQPQEGEVKIAFEDDSLRPKYFVGLWRGMPRELSPSGAMCDGAFIDLTVTVIPPSDNRKPNQPPQRNAGSRPSSMNSPVSETPSSLGPRG
jgi:hypothetical protein